MTVSSITFKSNANSVSGVVDARKAGVHQALSHDLGRVIGGGRIKKEMLIVHRVRMDLIQFKLCHTPMVGRSRAAMLVS